MAIDPEGRLSKGLNTARDLTPRYNHFRVINSILNSIPGPKGEKPIIWKRRNKNKIKSNVPRGVKPEVIYLLKKKSQKKKTKKSGKVKTKVFQINSMTDIMPFGKYKGDRLIDVFNLDREYFLQQLNNYKSIKIRENSVPKSFLRLVKMIE